MCHNHSHCTAEITGLLLVGETHLMEVRVTQPLAMELPYGEKWTKPSGSTLYLPVSMCGPLPAGQHQAMVVSYIPSASMADAETITMPEMPAMPSAAGNYGLTRSVGSEPYAHLVRKSNEQAT